MFVLPPRVCGRLGWRADHYHRTRNNEPSEAFTAFDIAQLLEDAGFRVEQQVNGERTTNSASGRAQILAAGTFVREPMILLASAYFSS